MNRRESEDVRSLRLGKLRIPTVNPTSAWNFINSRCVIPTRREITSAAATSESLPIAPLKVNSCVRYWPKAGLERSCWARASSSRYTFLHNKIRDSMLQLLHTKLKPYRNEAGSPLQLSRSSITNSRIRPMIERCDGGVRN